MKPEKDDSILRSILEDEALAAVRTDSLARGLEAARRARQIRQATKAVVVIGIGFGCLLSLWNPVRSRQEALRAPAVSRVAPAKTSSRLEVTMVNDEELLRLFPGRSVALIGVPGRQELVFLENGAKR